MKHDVALIIPFFNEESNLRDSVESAVVQSYINLEIVLVNDASTDSSLKVAQSLLNEFPDRNLKLVSHETNKGLGPARNTGISSTESDYIMFLDSDDKLLGPDSISIAVQAISQKKADIGVFNHVLGYEDGTSSENPTQHQLSLAKTSDSNLQQTKVHLLRNHHVAWNKIYSRQLLAKVEKYPSGSYEDIPVSYSCIMLANAIAIVEEPLVCYRQRVGASKSESQLKSNSVKHFDVFDRYNQLFPFAQKHNVDKAVCAEMYSRMIFQFVSIYHARQRIPHSKRKEFFNLMKDHALKYRHFSGRPNSLRELIIRFLIFGNHWRTSHLIFKIYALSKRVGIS